MSDPISRLKNALDTDIPPHARKAIHDAIHQIKRANEEVKYLKGLLADMNAKHVAIADAIRKCHKLLNDESIIRSGR